MKEDFLATAEVKGLDCEFTFAAYTYRLQTFNNSNGGFARINLDCEQLPLVLRAYLDDICKQVNDDIVRGDAVMDVIQRYSSKGEVAPGLFVIKGEAKSYGMAFGNIHAAMQIVMREYVPEMFFGKAPAAQPKFRVLDGGMA